MTLYVVPIVEGQTEDGCIERLLQRIWKDLLASTERLQVLMPSRGLRDALVRQGGTVLPGKVEEANAKLRQRLHRDPTGRGMLLILLDAESDLPCELAPRLLQTARLACGDVDIACVLAKRMLSNWIAAGADALAGVNGLPNPLQPPEDPENRSGLKWIDAQLRSVNPARKYKKTTDAKVFVASMNLQWCQANAPSFAKLCKELAARAQPQPDPEPK